MLALGLVDVYSFDLCAFMSIGAVMHWLVQVEMYATLSTLALRLFCQTKQLSRLISSDQCSTTHCMIGSSVSILFVDVLFQANLD